MFNTLQPGFTVTLQCSDFFKMPDREENYQHFCLEFFFNTSCCTLLIPAAHVQVKSEPQHVYVTYGCVRAWTVLF